MNLDDQNYLEQIDGSISTIEIDPAETGSITPFYQELG
jgi:hypothetical protein